ncbi:MAG: flagellar basal body-associated FliL family protein [Treponema sp.]|nr:flagellar basal body-associated FliL family protein [Treponema sp.]
MESIFNRVLAIIAVSILLIILIVTGVSFALKKAAPGKNVRVPDPEPGAVVSMTAPDNSKLAAFTGLGRLRAVTKPNPVKVEDTGTPVVITPWLSYPEGDAAFYEELARKSTMMRALITQYFSQYTEDELLKKGEDIVKTELLAELNEHFSLNKIAGIYFSDYIFFE